MYYAEEKTSNGGIGVAGGVEAGTLLGLNVAKRSASIQNFSRGKVSAVLLRASIGYERDVNIELILQELEKNIYPGITTQEIERALVLSVQSFIERDPAYGRVAMRLLLMSLYKEVLGVSSTVDNRKEYCAKGFAAYLHKGVGHGVLSDELLSAFDLERLSAYIDLERDQLFEFMGLYTIYEKYMLKVGGVRIEVPQYFWMRIAMGIALGEKPADRMAKAEQFYDLISQFSYLPGTPTLLHSGTTRSQLSSCYITTITDDLLHIFKCLSDNAQLSKYSGGVGNDWTNLRGTGSLIKSIDVHSQGVVPFLKLVNDVTTVINRSGKRRGATAVYLETWHLDIEDYLDLRRNTGDERRRAHDINTANWIPDLFMQRVEQDGQWTLFSPSDTPDLHSLYGAAFKKRYEEYEAMIAQGLIKQYKQLEAKQLWKKMLTRIFETGHPWITFKDAFNVRSTQDHVGVIYSSNLCTEIGLNTSATETAVCNLGSVNVARHMENGRLDEAKLAVTIKVAMNMLDNVIDVNFYPTIEAKVSNLRHRPTGLGLMGVQDALFIQGLPFDTEQAAVFCDELMETISYYAISASAELARDRGAYESFKGSKWDRGIFPIDTLELLEHERGEAVTVDRIIRKDWAPVREMVKKYGMRNSNTMAIAPTVTIANIAGCGNCIEPIYKNMYVKANQQGEFTIMNKYLVAALKECDLWNYDMCQRIKYYDGSIQQITSIPEDIRKLYKTAFEIDPEWLINLSARRAKWLDQAQSHNIFMLGTSGKKLNDVYFAAWRSGMKSTYYLRTLGASQIEKSTLDAKEYGFTQKRLYAAEAIPATESSDLRTCGIDRTDCESCQ
ncbi:MAG: ribonucleoside-diphosphate reductase alpha chain [Candidatus Dependentiae bacterium]|nr:ribonucleoside-diphosphate reductase alpha chain [Candidatus Dependentiae bacterium]